MDASILQFVKVLLQRSHGSYLKFQNQIMNLTRSQLKYFTIQIDVGAYVL
jgi:hypothetical protein